MENPRLIGAVLIGFGLALASGRCAHAADQTVTSVRLGDGVTPWAAPAGDMALAGVSSGLPGWLRWALAPQLRAETSILPRSPERTFQSLSWNVPLADSVLERHDALSFGFSVGHAFGGIMGLADNAEQRSAWPMPTTRLGATIGYQVTPDVGLFVVFDHTASTRSAHEDDFSNNLGVRLGLRF